MFLGPVFQPQAQLRIDLSIAGRVSVPDDLGQVAGLTWQSVIEPGPARNIPSRSGLPLTSGPSPADAYGGYPWVTDTVAFSCLHWCPQYRSIAVQLCRNRVSGPVISMALRIPVHGRTSMALRIPVHGRTSMALRIPVHGASAFAEAVVREPGCARRHPRQWCGVAVPDLVDALGELPAVSGALVTVVVDGVVQL